jgi:nitrite reductase/ring-hydroxylating ferredoxin subunit
MASPVDVGLVDDLPNRKIVSVRAGEREIVLVRWDDEVYALRNICPHMSASLTTGKVMGYYTGNITAAGEIELEVEEGNPIIACPWHKYEFFLKDGSCLTNASLRIRSYPVTVEDGRVFVDMSGSRAAMAATPAQQL